MIVIYLVYLIILFYFTVDDYQYNPFKNYGIKPTKIRFKSKFLSSCTNIALFVSKPLLSDIARNINRNCNQRVHISGLDRYLIHKRLLEHR